MRIILIAGTGHSEDGRRMKNFNPGDLVCLKDRFSPEMMVIQDNHGTGTVLWQDALGEAMTENFPSASLKAVPLPAKHVPSSVFRFADLMRRL
jgi:hypothetical protein